MNEQDFAQFLKLLSPDAEEAGRLYTSLHKKLTCFFSLKGISDPVSCADESIDRAVMKISAGAIVPDVYRYCFGFARNIVNERFRLRQREDSAFHKFIEDLSNSSAEQVERIYSILKPCFERLAAKDQELLRKYCHKIKGRARAEYRRQLAETMGITMLALRVRVKRLRESLTNCIKKRSDNI